MKKVIFSIAYISSPIFLAALIYMGNPGGYRSLWGAGSMLFGVFAYTWLNWQFVVSARPKWLEKGVGMDFLYRFHGMMAILAIGAAVAHELLKKMVFGETLMTWVGSAAIYIFAAVSAVSIAFMVQNRIHRIKRLNDLRQRLHEKHGKFYEALKRFHAVTLAGQILIVVHVLMTSQVRSSDTAFAAYMAVFLIAFGHYFWHKLIKPWLISYQSLVVSKVENVTLNPGDVPFMRHVHFRREGGSRPHVPGQFAFFRFPAGRSLEEHPFTIASSPTEDEWVVSIKSLGDFTSDPDSIKTGDEVLMDGPYGRFSYLKYPDEQHIVFMVAGIGITPALAMIRHKIAVNDPREMTLNWQVRKPDEAVFLDEVANDAKHHANLHVNLFYDEPADRPLQFYDSVDYIQGSIADHLGKAVSRAYGWNGYYLCGPGVFMDGLAILLRGSGVKRSRLHMESFSY